MVEAHDGLARGGKGMTRCWWCAGDAQYEHYHDTEWGWPVDDDRRLFEKLCLEGFQSGLSWITILRKRDNFREAFHGFDPERVARMTQRDVRRLLGNAGIVRHRGKIEATITNAKALARLLETTGSLAEFVWQFEPPADDRPPRVDHAAVRQLAKTPASTALSRALKKVGFVWVGPTTAYAFMQSMGLVNDHLEGCSFRKPVENARNGFSRPS